MLIYSAKFVAHVIEALSLQDLRYLEKPGSNVGLFHLGVLKAGREVKREVAGVLHPCTPILSA